VICRGGIIMPIKSYTCTYYEDGDGNSFPIPFKPDEDSILLHIRGDKAVIGCLARDEYPDDPLDMFAEGEFYQFNSYYVHYQPRPDVEDFKRTVRANPGRVVLVYVRGGYQDYSADDKAFDVHHTKLDAILEIEDADGYCIVPNDFTNPVEYAKGLMEEYSAWINGDVWGICAWLYSKHGGEWELDEDLRDECWGLYSREDAADELESLFKYYIEKPE